MLSKHKPKVQAIDRLGDVCLEMAALVARAQTLVEELKILVAADVLSDGEE